MSSQARLNRTENGTESAQAHLARTDQNPGIWHAFHTEAAAETWAAEHTAATGQTVYILPTNQEQP